MIMLCHHGVKGEYTSGGGYNPHHYDHEGHTHSRPIRVSESQGYHMNPEGGFYDKA